MRKIYAQEIEEGLEFYMRNFTNAKRIVIKVGTNTLTKACHRHRYIDTLAAQIASLTNRINNPAGHQRRYRHGRPPPAAWWSG